MNIDSNGLPKKIFLNEYDITGIEESSEYTLLAKKSSMLTEKYILKIRNKRNLKIKDYGVIHEKRKRTIIIPYIFPFK